MTPDPPVACSLGATDLTRRLAAIARIGADNLISHEQDGDRHLLRFHAGGDARGQLEAIVAAEARCCSFLDLALSEDGDELVLSIAAAQEGQPVADQLARTFAGEKA